MRETIQKGAGVNLKKIVLCSSAVAIIAGTTVVFHATQSFYKNFIQGERYFQAKRYAEALPYLSEAVHLNPENKQANLYLLGVYESTGQKKQAAVLLVSLLDQFRTDVSFKTDLGDLYSKLSNFAQAERLYTDVVAARPTVDNERKLAQVIMWQGKYKEGIEHLSALVGKYPGNLTLLELLADGYTWSNNFDQASAIYKELVEKKYHLKSSLFKLAEVLRYSGKNEEAIRVYNTYLSY